MSESPKVEIVFEYTRARDGVYSGTATVVETGETNSVRPPLHTVVHQPEWVKFVVDTIKAHQEAQNVTFVLHKKEGGETRYQLAQRTVEQIKDGRLSAADLVL